ncbi:hypothetical protein SAMN02745166_05114 [Prosthecobacter debontii]|uniref:Uncharacterized protein n=1 Tax=Prosthecobacter debontii TaxID=48467 RepID=A0A1T4Z5C0_9BACT|nr:hypothetical protein [Prosthecobacter debontii]SKB09204.1 hypothetical protein SAMN02745166_05114 [Prosthecobacter debontii]
MNAEIETLMSAVLSLSRDAKRDKQLAKLIRELTPAEQLPLIDRLLEEKCQSSLFLLRSAADHKICEIMLFKHLPRADASSIQDLLRLGVEILGERKLGELVIKTSIESPRVWEYAAYWLPSLLSKEMWEKLQARYRNSDNP